MAKCGADGHQDKSLNVAGHRRRSCAAEANWLSGNEHEATNSGPIGRLHSQLIGPVSSLAPLLIMMISLLIIMTPRLAQARTTTTTSTTTTTITNGKPALNDDDLIEGRLDSSRLCGMRWPTSEGNQQQQRRRRRQQQLQQHHLRSEAPSEATTTTTTAFEFAANNNSKLDAESELDPTNQSERFGLESGKSNENLLYIVGGDEVDDEQLWPWSVAIYELDPLNGQRSFICSGSLISEKFVLTAAHCIQQSRFDILTPDEIFLKIASIRLDDERADFYRVERIHIHPNYMVDRKTNDIALLRLSRFNQRLPQRARPICLPSSVANRIDFTNQEVTIIGWGKTSAMQGNEPSRLIDIGGKAAGGSPSGWSSSSLSSSRLAGGGNQNETLARHGNADEQQTDDTLLQAHVRVTSTDQCNKDYSKLEISWLQIDEHFLCASDPQGKRDACQGDSGGPLMWNDNNLYANNRRKRQDVEQEHERAAAVAVAATATATATATANQEKWYQLGLVSFGYGCANRQYPGVYTRIAYYMPWILKTVNERDVAVGGGGGGGHMLSTMINHNHHKQQQQHQQQQQLGSPANSFKPAALHHQGRN